MRTSLLCGALAADKDDDGETVGDGQTVGGASTSERWCGGHGGVIRPGARSDKRWRGRAQFSTKLILQYSNRL
jgi:hypothetical protein